jgi:non-specific protein-tyrosine kinase
MSSSPDSVGLEGGPRLRPVAAGWRGWLHRLASRPAADAPVPASASLPPDLEAGSPFLAACRQLRVRLAPGAAEVRLPPLLLLGADASPAYGLTAAGLAVALAEAGRATLLVDADLRQPGLHRLFGLTPSAGFADLILNPAAEPTIIAVTGTLSLLLAGEAQPDADSCLGLPTLGQAVQRLTDRFEAVIFHTAGHWDCADVLLLGPPIGRAAFLIRAGREVEPAMRRVRAALDGLEVTVLGFAMLD